MLKEKGEQELREFHEKNFQMEIAHPSEHVWFVKGLGHANAVFIEGAHSVILIDTLDSVERGERLRTIIKEKTDKEVKTIFYTHAHPDHRGGAQAFVQSNPEIIAFAPIQKPLEYTEMLQDIQAQRGARQFGYALSDEEAITQGIGIREGVAYGEHRGCLAPTKVYDEEEHNFMIDGIVLDVRRCNGECEDTILLWLPQEQILICGDHYYGCFPNLYAIRGGQYRDLAQWIHTLDLIAAYPAEVLLPGHTQALYGAQTIQTHLTNIKEAFKELLLKTLQGMNEGKSIDTLASEIRLSKQYEELPYFQEHYGCVEWSVRSIYNAYLGWFDGNPTHLHPLPPVDYARHIVDAMQGREQVLINIHTALANQEYQWCLELCDFLLVLDAQDEAAKKAKAQALRNLAKYETSANGRHYYLACAKAYE